VIECIPAAKSRHDLGRSTSQYLLEYFIGKYGQVGTPAFQEAQANFVKSMAPYSLICYLFQVKDRHNANIMIDQAGHVLHIDFGFIFEISPGGNFRFERSPFKLTREMIDVMGGGKEAPAFRQFASLLTKCFLATRARHEELEAIAFLMMSAGFPCFRADSIKKLQQRFFLDRGERDVVVEIQQLINDAYEAMTTTVYDTFQSASNQIFF
jgi:phosphatidylinositol 4-kinase